MKTEIFSRENIEKVIAKNRAADLSKKTAAISFRDRPMMPDDPYCRPVKYPTDIAVFHCIADDVAYDDFVFDSPKTRKVSLDNFFLDATKMANFVLEQSANGVEKIICQCEYGQSRSAGAAAAIEQFYNKSGIEIFADYRYCPNQIIYNKLYNALVTQSSLEKSRPKTAY